MIVNYCCTRVLLYAMILKETKTEETIVFFVTFLSLVAFQLGGSGPTGPPGYAYGGRGVCPHRRKIVKICKCEFCE